MDGLVDFLETLRRHQLVRGNFRAILHIIIGRTIRTVDGTLVSQGVTWRVLARMFQEIRWDKELVRELGINPDDLSPRDRQRYWFQAMMKAKLVGEDVNLLADEFGKLVSPFGYVISPTTRN